MNRAKNYARLIKALSWVYTLCENNVTATSLSDEKTAELRDCLGSNNARFAVSTSSVRIYAIGRGQYITRGQFTPKRKDILENAISFIDATVRQVMIFDRYICPVDESEFGPLRVSETYVVEQRLAKIHDVLMSLGVFAGMETDPYRYVIEVLDLQPNSDAVKQVFRKNGWKTLSTKTTWFGTICRFSISFDKITAVTTSDDVGQQLADLRDEKEETLNTLRSDLLNTNMAH